MTFSYFGGGVVWGRMMGYLGRDGFIRICLVYQTGYLYYHCAVRDKTWLINSWIFLNTLLLDFVECFWRTCRVMEGKVTWKVCLKKKTRKLSRKVEPRTYYHFLLYLRSRLPGFLHLVQMKPWRPTSPLLAAGCLCCHQQTTSITLINPDLRCLRLLPPDPPHPAAATTTLLFLLMLPIMPWNVMRSLPMT